MLGGIGALFAVLGLKFDYYGLLGPGPGFFPVWIGLILAGSCLILLVQTFFRHDDPQPFFLSSAAARRVLGLAASLVAAWLVLDVVGFRLTVLAFALIVPHVLDRQRAVTTVVVAVTASFGVAYGFESWLLVQLPEPAFGWLRDLGL